MLTVGLVFSVLENTLGTNFLFLFLFGTSCFKLPRAVEGGHYESENYLSGLMLL